MAQNTNNHALCNAAQRPLRASPCILSVLCLFSSLRSCLVLAVLAAPPGGYICGCSLAGIAHTSPTQPPT
jgi:hypothetical protein